MYVLTRGLKDAVLKTLGLSLMEGKLVNCPVLGKHHSTERLIPLLARETSQLSPFEKGGQFDRTANKQGDLTR